MSSSCSVGTFDIVYISDEVLMKIILHLNARERVALANSSKRFYSLVFEEKKLLRDLDFSEDGWLTNPNDIQQYFNNENSNKYILKVNLRNVCIKPQILTDCISKASNLVDINIHGTELRDIRQLESMLELLTHVERLSIDWPRTGTPYNVFGNLEQKFSRLKYLSTKIYSDCAVEFFRLLELCQELKELHIVHDNSFVWRGSTTTRSKLKNLQILEACGTNALCLWLKKYLLAFLPNRKNWTNFRLVQPLDRIGIHLEKDIEVCDELLASQCLGRWLPPRLLLEQMLYKSYHLQTECLLKDVIRITQEKVPEEFCSAQFKGKERCALQIEEAKLLLKNPRYKIKYLYLKQSIGTKCDVHLFALASPSLTELYLSDVMKIKKSISKQADFQERLGWRSHLRHWEENYLTNRCLLDSSFKAFVENTPLVENLTLNGTPGTLQDDEAWDLGGLCLIRRWTNLKSLRLLSIPISDGEFLIEIGKQCTQLEKLQLYNLGPSNACCYTKELSLMLTHCQNLTDFSIFASNIGMVSDVFLSLAKNLKLRKVRLKSSGKTNNTVNLVSSVEQLLRRCSKLTTFVCIIDGISPADSEQLTTVLRRLRTELNRPTLQFQVLRNSNSGILPKTDTVREDSLPPSFPYTWDEFNHL